jgi:hypothetical protein
VLGWSTIQAIAARLLQLRRMIQAGLNASMRSLLVLFVKRHAATGMSALGHKQTSAGCSGMSALPPKADILSVEIDVC